LTNPLTNPFRAGDYVQVYNYTVNPQNYHSVYGIVSDTKGGFVTLKVTETDSVVWRLGVYLNFDWLSLKLIQPALSQESIIKDYCID